MTIHIEVLKDLDLLYAKGLAIIEAKLEQGATTFGLATGGTMLPLYEKIRASSIDFSSCVSFNLDEYVGLPATHSESYRTFMRMNLFDAKPFAKSELPDGLAADVEAEAIAYEEKLQNAHLNFQLLGIGENGHIGFNEPGTPFDSTTHVVELTQSTRQANARFFNSIDEVPTHAITMGISSILRADTILLIAVGEKKRRPLEALLKGDQTTEVPVTALQDHKNIIILTDLDI
ncbi:glucosamine-6-phosphate deaminase [Kurthia sibirica]|uniref:glucosamine-6-phosphate deaminase n=1 Tax=Kurthia sibirica TaxID=202750 RepID=UPI001175B4FE|nr:glucosamine-6-phosphate deaminase [Kurthia sibirica]GEK33350.1 glucosamine-6-phosphate deaminase [Kurthia sibirica]